ncbi:MAG TPA: toast rack family protein [Bryobacteraceae bacterium]|jgi:hypothetical protein
MRKAVLILAAVALAGCGFPRVHTGPTVHETKSIDLGKFEMARVELKMGVGELHLDGGSPNLVDADFEYNVPEWKPRVDSSSSSFRADVKIEQSNSGGASGNAIDVWRLRMNDNVPLNLVTHLGTGQATLNLGSVTIRSLQVNMGVGELRLDLRGHPKNDFDVEIHGGVGEATVIVPNSVGISAMAKGGVGDISVEGLQKRNDRWENDAYSTSNVRIRLNITGGVGDIHLRAE